MKKTLLFVIRFYQKIISPILVILLGHGCRFSPTCSQYAEIAVQRHGIIKGGKLSLSRLTKCHPFNRASYFDPVPEI